MKATHKILPLLWLVSIFTLTGCHGQRTIYKDGDGGLVRININWSAIVERPEHVRLALYPTSGEEPLEYYIDPSGGQVTIPYGSYHVLAYNWRSNKDTQRIQFGGKNKFETMQAYTDLLQGSLFGENVIQQPDELANWSSNVDILTINRPDCDDDWEDLVLNIYPLQMVNTYDFYIPATGLQYVRSAEAILTGVSRYKTLHNGEADATSYSVSVSMTPSTGKIEFHFSAFGFVPQEDYMLKIKFILIDGSVFEYTRNMKEDIARKNRAINDLIVIPEVVGETGGFEEPEINDWKEVSEDIPI